MSTITSFLPAYAEIIIISILIALATTFAYKYFTDQAVMKEIRKRQKALQEQIKTSRDNQENVMAINKELMSLNARYMKHSMKPMLITILPFLFIFGYLKGVYGADIVIPLFFWKGHMQWLGTYIIVSMVFTSLFRKLFKVA